jgi:Family of unknown function (DUF6286)
VAQWPFGSLFALADKVRGRVQRAVARADLDRILGQVTVAFEDVREAASEQAILLLRATTRLVTFALLAALSVCGLAIAVFSIGWSRTGDFNLPGLARLVHLGDLRDQIGELLHDLAANGPVAGITALCGLAAIVLGILLLVGALWPRREPLVVLERGGEGTLAARRRVLARVASTLAEQTRGVTATNVKVRPGRRRGGRLTVRADHSRSQQPQDVRQHVQLALAPLTNAFGLRARIRPRLGAHRRRVE